MYFETQMHALSSYLGSVMDFSILSKVFPVHCDGFHFSRHVANQINFRWKCLNDFLALFWCFIVLLLNFDHIWPSLFQNLNDDADMFIGGSICYACAQLASPISFLIKMSFDNKTALTPTTSPSTWAHPEMLLKRRDKRQTFIAWTLICFQELHVFSA